MVSFLRESRLNLAWMDPPREPLLARGHVHVWYWDFHRVRDLVAFEVCLSRDEIARLARFKTEESKRNFLGSHIFLRRVLSLYVKSDPSSIEFESNSQGKPHLAAPVHAEKLEFNLSHSHQRVLCAVARDVQVGIDLEPVYTDLYDEGTGKLVFGEDELAVLRRLDPTDRSEAFFWGWTRKEAYAKCMGVGLSEDLKNVELSFTIPAAVVGGVDVRTFYCPDGYVGSVAAMPPAFQYVFFEWH